MMKIVDWKLEAIKNFKLYGVTDLKDDNDSIVEKVDQAYSGGVDIIQMRSKALSDKTLYHLGLKLRKIASAQKKLFFVNDRLDLALALDADGLHVGQDDLPVKRMRDILAKLNRPMFIGKSTHSLAQALQTSQEDVDYIGVGPIFSTPTKPTYEAIGLKLISEVKKNIRIPFVTIGGINEENLEQVLEAGATRVAIVRGLFNTGDTYESSKRIKHILERNN